MRESVNNHTETLDHRQEIIYQLTGYCRDTSTLQRRQKQPPTILKCPLEGCSYRFTRSYDLVRHLRSERFHGDIEQSILVFNNNDDDDYDDLLID